MQVSEAQVQRSLRALTGAPDRTSQVAGSTSSPSPDPVADPTASCPDVAASADRCPDGLVEALMGAPSIRDDRLDEARRHLEAGEQPSPEALAQRMVGRLVCDRLR